MSDARDQHAPAGRIDQPVRAVDVAPADETTVTAEGGALHAGIRLKGARGPLTRDRVDDLAVKSTIQLLTRSSTITATRRHLSICNE